MEHSDFTSRHSWMNGLQEYYRDTEFEEKYNLIYKALYHNNKYRLRDIMITLHDMIKVEELDDKDNTLKSFYNTLLYEQLGDYDVKARVLAHLISFWVKDPYIERLYQFLLYFHHNNIIGVPDMNDFFSRGQVRSKLWLIEELRKVVSGDELGTAVMYGGWYNFLTHMLVDRFKVDTIWSLDIDEKVIAPSRHMYKDIVDYRFRSITANVNNLKWDEEGLWYVDEKKRQSDYDNHYQSKLDEIQQGLYDPSKAKVWSTFGWKKIGEVDIVINTSCEHMDNKWFYNLPKGTFVCLQTNDYFSNPQHVNCVQNLTEAKQIYPMRKYFCAEGLSTELYNRFMLIGIR